MPPESSHACDSLISWQRTGPGFCGSRASITARSGRTSWKVLIASAAFLVNDYVSYRNQMAEDLEVYAYVYTEVGDVEELRFKDGADR